MKTTPQHDTKHSETAAPNPVTDHADQAGKALIEVVMNLEFRKSRREMVARARAKMKEAEKKFEAVERLHKMAKKEEETRIPTLVKFLFDAYYDILQEWEDAEWEYQLVKDYAKLIEKRWKEDLCYRGL